MRAAIAALWLFVYVFLAPSAAQASEPWHQINTDLYQIIFPLEAADEAQRVATLMDTYLAAHLEEFPLDKPFRKIPIVLYTTAHESNGNVGSTPYRSRWYNQPMPFANLEWFTALAVHEGRHMVQFNQVGDNALGEVLQFAAGDLGTNVFIGLFLPSWFLEGDAVVSETTLTNGGRGRVAAFNLWFRTDLLNNPAYSYDRAMLGTGLDRVPYLSPYLLGYYLTGDARMQYGDKVYDTILRDIGKLDSFNLDAATKKATGKNLNQMYLAMVKRQRSEWQQQLDQLDLTPITLLSQPRGKHWQSLYPIAAAHGKVSAVSVDVKRGQHLVSVANKQSERIIDLPHSASSSYYSGTKARAVSQHEGEYCWVDHFEHPTKPNQQRGDIVCWAETTGLVQITHGDKLTSVIHGPEGFIAHRFTSKRESQLVMFNRAGNTLKVVDLPKHSIAYDFSLHGNQLAFALSNENDSGLYLFDTNIQAENNQIQLLKQSDNETLRAPVLTKHWLIFTSDKTGIDQLMAMSLTSQKVYQIATRPYGVYYPVYDATRQQIVFADYTAQGQQLAAIDFDDSPQPDPKWLAIESVASAEPFVATLIPNVLPKAANESSNYPQAPYSPLKNLWNVHSWGITSIGSQVSGFVISDDILEKLHLELGAGYDFTNSEAFGAVEAQYRLDLGPTLSLGLEKASPTNGSQTDWQASVLQSFSYRHGTVSQTWTPSVGVNQTIFKNGAQRGRLAASLETTIAKERAFQAIQAPFIVSQQLLTDFATADQSQRVLVNHFLGFRTFSSRQALDLTSSVQWLESPDASLLGGNLLFSPVAGEGVTWQGQANYRIQLGAVGASLTSLAYWRNTEVQLNAKAQSTQGQTETAVGATLKPSFNLLRNSLFLLAPSLSYYVRPDTGDAQIQFGLSLGNF